MIVPTTSEDFDRAYRAPVTFWGDLRIPGELKALLRERQPRTSLELGCGVGRSSRYVAEQGIRATAVDFSPVAIARAKAKSTKAEYLVGDVTNLESLTGPYDVAFDIGCVHCLAPAGQDKYVAELDRLLGENATYLMWALDHTPSDLTFTPELVRRVFAPRFTLQAAKASRRRLVSSHWYWLTRS